MSNDDLAAFLLARIAEDEQVVIAAPGTEGNELYVLDDDYRHNLIVISRTRVLAECEAKRRIVELHGIDSDPCDATPASGRYRATWCDWPPCRMPPTRTTGRSGDLDQHPAILGASGPGQGR